jgi:AcrR family transcriptional regulator
MKPSIVPVIYHYFKTKQDVFLSLYRQKIESWLADGRS